MLSNEERKLFLDAYEKGYKTKDLSEIFIDTSWQLVFLYINIYSAPGCVWKLFA